MKTLFGTDGVRGVANQDPMTSEMAMRIGRAAAHIFRDSARKHRIVIGKDTRLSGYMIESALTSGLCSMGMDVLLIGPVPTPGIAFLTRSLRADAGAVISASHNPFQDNGIKLFSHDGFKLPDEVEEQIEALVFSRELDDLRPTASEVGKAYRIEDARGRYIEFAKGVIGNESLDGLRVVLDCANGAAYLIGPWIFKELGARVTKAFAEPDGYNINNGCGALHPETVGRLVRRHGADLGIAFDGDADRVIFTDSSGNVLDGDHILALFAIEFQERGMLRNNTLVVTSMSNLGLHEAMAGRGIRVEVTDVGDRNVIDRMRQAGHSLGGEKSGHVIFMDCATTGDGIITALQALRLMKQKGRSIAELAACMTDYPQKLVSLPTAERRPIEELDRVQAARRECEQALGAFGRVILRYSGTEPKVRILVEARDPAAVEEWTRRLVEAFQAEGIVAR